RVIVVDHDGDIRLGLCHPVLGFLEAREHALPVRLLGLLVVDRRADRRHVRRRHSCDDPSHVSPSPCWTCRIWIWPQPSAGRTLPSPPPPACQPCSGRTCCDSPPPSDRRQASWRRSPPVWSRSSPPPDAGTSDHRSRRVWR